MMAKINSFGKKIQKGYTWPFDMTMTVLFFLLVGLVFYLVLGNVLSSTPSTISGTGFNLMDFIIGLIP